MTCQNLPHYATKVPSDITCSTLLSRAESDFANNKSIDVGGSYNPLYAIDNLG